MNIVKTVKPLGHRVLIRPDFIEEKSKGGIYLPQDTVKQEQGAQVIGTVLDVGSTAYAEYDSPWCKVGDRVVFAKYSGMKLWNPVEGKYREDILLINDLDICGLVTEEEEIND